MEFLVDMSTTEYDALLRHLLPAEAEAEEAAFLFARVDHGREATRLRVISSHLVDPTEFRIRTIGHLDLREEVHERMIKTAHDLDAALVEVHSHPYDTPGAACFSWSDRRGLEQVVPHVMWRLPGRPYAAIVVAPEGLDGLVWPERGASPRKLQGIQHGKHRAHATGYTLDRGWWGSGSV